MYPLLMGYSVAIFPFALLKIDLNTQKSSIHLDLRHSLDTPIIYIIISKNIVWIVDYSPSL